MEKNKSHPAIVLFFIQFLGALNDNLFKTGFVLWATFQAAHLAPFPVEILVSAAGGIFILPFFLFSAWAGILSDRFAKNQVIWATKLLEVLVMILGAIGFLWSSYPLLLVSLFLMGGQSAIFGPAKYASLPELVNTENLLKANAWFGLGTFCAILLGTIGSGLLIAPQRGGVPLLVGLFLAIAVLGWALSFFQPIMRPANPRLALPLNPFGGGLHLWRLFRHSSSVGLVFLAISWFWFLGASILTLVPLLTKNLIQGNEDVATFFLGTFTIGVSIGGLGLGRLPSLGKHAIGVGSFFMALSLFDFGINLKNWSPTELTTSLTSLLANPDFLRLSFDLLVFSISSAFYILPLQTYLQTQTPPENLAQCIAANNILNAGFMVMASGLLLLCFSFSMHYGSIIHLLCAGTLLVGLGLRLSLFRPGFKI